MATNALPESNDPGLFVNPYSGEELETHLATGPSGEGVCVRYWNESICLAQTALINNSAEYFLNELIVAGNEPHRLVHHCLSLDISPAEYLYVRNLLSPERWGLLVAQISLSVWSVCFMAQAEPQEYARFMLMLHPFQSYPALASVSYDAIISQINDQIGEYATGLSQRFKSGSRSFDSLPRLMPLKMLYLAERRQLNLAVLFKAAEGSLADLASIYMTRMNLYQVGLCHMAHYQPDQFVELQLRLGEIINPMESGADLEGHQGQIELLGRALEKYTDRLVIGPQLSQEDDQFSDSELNSLFNLE